MILSLIYIYFVVQHPSDTKMETLLSLTQKNIMNFILTNLFSSILAVFQQLAPSDTKIVDDSDTGLYSDSIRTIHRLYSDYIQTILGLDIDYIQTIHLQYNIYTIAYNLSNLTRVSSTKLLLPAINNTYLYILSGFILHILISGMDLLSLVTPETFRSRTVPTTQSGYTRDVSLGSSQLLSLVKPETFQ